MKAGLLAASAIALAQLALAQPHGNHRHLHKRDPAQVTTTVLLPEVVVYVDEQGNKLGAETKTPSTTSITSSSTPPPSTTSTSTSESSSVSPVEAYVQPTTTTTEAAPSPTTTETPTSTPEPSSEPAPTSAASSGGGGGGGASSLEGVKGATYSPYNSDGTCKDSGSVSSDIATLAQQGFGAIRIYGVDCNQVANAVPAAKEHGLSVIAGLFNIGSVSSDLSSMKSQLGGDFSSLAAITVYNEPINNGQLDASGVAAAIGEAKGFLKSTNFAGGVAGVDTFSQLVQSSNSAVIEASDFVAANCHSYFDTTTSPSGAGSFVQNRCIDALKAVSGGKSVIITESGWPSQAPSGGMGSNVASTDGQSTAIGQIRSLFGVFAFSYFSTAWHKTPDSVENYWGFAEH